MLRRAMLHGACIAGALCLLLLLAGSRYTDNVNYRPPSESRRNIKNFLRLAPEDGGDPPPETNLIVASLSNDGILERTRSKLQRELANFTLNGIAEVKSLEDLIPEHGGRPLRSVIVSSWRSGTTFLGEVLNAIPGTFYHYEPLLSYEIIQIRGPPHAAAALQHLRKMLACNFTDMAEYFEYGRTHLHQFNHNTRLWEVCKYDRRLCLDPDFTSRFCRLFPFQSMKVVRLRLRLMEELMAEPELNVRAVLLVRDPRGVLQSRQHRDFCLPSPDCSRPALLCADMISDYVAAGRLLQLYPHRFTVLRYEDLALNADATAHSLLGFLSLDGGGGGNGGGGVDAFLREHTSADLGGVSSTFRLSRDVPFRWTKALSFDYVSYIQEECKEAMSLWGYHPAHNASHLRSEEFVPLERYTVH